MDAFDRLLDLALEEDLGSMGDVTSQAIFTDRQGRAQLYAKEEGVLAGIPYFRRTFNRIDPDISLDFVQKDGDRIEKERMLATLAGPVKSILEGERIAINFLSFLSGIATETSRYVEAATSGRAVILDTRKTLPGYREISKYAVALGGARNHRMGLYDMVMVKDNHIDAAGSISAAVNMVREKWGTQFRVEVETRNLDEVEQALKADVDIIMLDNMEESLCARALSLGAGRVLFEASGNMNLSRIASFSTVGVDFISVGALTHSVRAVDFSLRVIPNG